MEHLIDSLQCKIPLLIVMATLLVTQLLYLLGMPLQIDFKRSIIVLLDAIIICQFMFLIIMRNQIKRLSNSCLKLRINNKLTEEEFEVNKKQTTEVQVRKLIGSEEYKRWMEQQSYTSSASRSKTKQQSSSQSQATPQQSCHQMATRKKLF